METPPKSRKKVLFLITKATWGGAQRYVYDIATHLPREQFEVAVAYGQEGKLADDLEKAGIGTHAIPSLARDIAIISDIRSFFQIVELLKELRPDVLHLNSSKAAALGALAARIVGIKKIIFTVHGWPFKERRSAVVNKCICMVSWFTGALSHSTIVVSKTDLDIGKTFGGDVADKIHYIPIGIEPPQFLSRGEASSSLSIPTTTPRIVTIAELTANKGIRYAIEAVAELKKRGVDVSYFIIGNGEAREPLQRLARELHVAERIHFLGFIPEAQKYLKAFDIFLLPSIKEGMPYALLEAGAAGLPLITTNVVDPAFLEMASYDSVVKPGDSAAIADVISAVLKIPRERPVLVSPLENMVNATLELY